MADEAETQETTIEDSTADNVDTASNEAEGAAANGADVQGTDSDKADDSTKEAEQPAPKTYDEAYVKKLRDEAAAARVKGKEAAAQAAQEAAEKATRDFTEQIGRALGLIKDDVAPDPAELLKQAQDRETQLANERDTVASELRALRVEKALNAAADKFDGDKDILAPYLAGTGALKNLDPASEDFASQVEEVVSGAIESNPKLKKTADRVSAPRSGGDLSNGNAAPKPNSPKSVEDLVRERQKRRAVERS